MKEFIKECLDSKKTTIALGTILCIAAFLRIYQLDTPSLWGDELFPPIMVTKPFPYFFRWLFREEVHPPFYFGFIKLIILALGRSDFVLRLPSVVFGIVAVYIMYRVGEAWLDKESGLLAASILAVYPAHIYLSRVVRFYSFCVILCLVCLLLLKKYMDHHDDRNLLWLVVLLAGLLLAEFTAIMPIAAFFAVLLAVILTRSDRLNTLRRLAKYAGMAFFIPLCLLVLIAFRRQGFAMKNTVVDAITKFSSGLTWLLATPMPRGSHPWNFWLLAVLMLIGCVHLLRTGRRLLAVCLAFFLVPLCVIMIIRPGYWIAYWHLFFLLPIICLLVAAGFQAIIPRSCRIGMALGLSIAGALIVFMQYFQNYYTPTAYYEDSRQVAQALVSGTRPGDPILLDAPAIDFIDWYARQISLDDAWLNQEVMPKGSPLILTVVLDRNKHLGHLVTAQDPVISWATVQSSRNVGVSSIIKAAIERHPDIEIPLDGRKIVLDANPGNFYGHVHDASRVMIYPYWGNAVIPTRNNTPGIFSYVLINPDTKGKMILDLDLLYTNSGAGNRFRVLARYDEEHPEILWEGSGPELPDSDAHSDDLMVKRHIVLRRVKPFSHLDLTVEMTCGYGATHYPSSNLMSVGFSKLIVRAWHFNGDFLNKNAFDPLYTLTGFGGVEQEGDRHWRWALGKENSIAFTVDKFTPMQFTYVFVNPFMRQGYVLKHNGKILLNEKDIPHATWTDAVPQQQIEFLATPGENRLTFEFEKINKINDSFTDTDTNPYTAAFTTMRLERMPQ